MTPPPDAPERPNAPAQTDHHRWRAPDGAAAEGVERGGTASGASGGGVMRPVATAPPTFPGGGRGRPDGRRHLSASAGMAGAIGLLLLGGCGSLPRWSASASRAEQRQQERQQELRRMDEQHLALMQRLERRVQRLEERQRRLGQQTRLLREERVLRDEERRLEWEKQQ